MAKAPRASLRESNSRIDMPWTPSKHGTTQQQAHLRALAARKGYRAEHALMTGHWNLFDAAEKMATTATGSVNFRIEGAVSFLARLPDVAPPTAPEY
jgi:hypothetical protein